MFYILDTTCPNWIPRSLGISRIGLIGAHVTLGPSLVMVVHPCGSGTLAVYPCFGKRSSFLSMTLPLTLGINQTMFYCNLRHFEQFI